ncbi:MAG: hypothetical protein Q7S76_01540 [bacterium]|nr:hypothetical protein [bacterium]
MDKELQQKILESGHNLHLRVASDLENEGWDVELASYYVDDLSDKPREIDIVAEMPFHGGSVSDGSLEEIFRTRLFIECKHFKTPIALRTLPIDISEAHESIVTHTLGKTSSDIWGDRHHYAKPRVAKLWTTMEERNDPFFDGLASTTKSLLYYLGTRASRGIFYPVLVYDGIDGMYEIQGSDLSNLESAPLVKRALVSFNYAYNEVFTNKPRRRPLLIDVVHSDELPTLIKEVMKEGERAITKL